MPGTLECKPGVCRCTILCLPISGWPCTCLTASVFESEYRPSQGRQLLEVDVHSDNSKRKHDSYILNWKRNNSNIHEQRRNSIDVDKFDYIQRFDLLEWNFPQIMYPSKQQQKLERYPVMPFLPPFIRPGTHRPRGCPWASIISDSCTWGDKQTAQTVSLTLIMSSHRSRVIDNQICFNAKVRYVAQQPTWAPAVCKLFTVSKSQIYPVLTLSGSPQCSPAVPYSVWDRKYFRPVHAPCIHGYCIHAPILAGTCLRIQNWIRKKLFVASRLNRCVRRVCLIIGTSYFARCTHTKRPSRLSESE